VIEMIQSVIEISVVLLIVLWIGFVIGKMKK
jgi:hypothetical protein